MNYLPLMNLRQWIGAAVVAVVLTGCGKSPSNHVSPVRHMTMEIDERQSLLDIEQSMAASPDRRDYAIIQGKLFTEGRPDGPYMMFEIREVDAQTPDGPQRLPLMLVSGVGLPAPILLGSSPIARAEREGLKAMQGVNQRFADYGATDQLGRHQIEERWWASATPFYSRTYHRESKLDTFTAQEEGRLQTWNYPTFPFVPVVNEIAGTAVVVTGQIGLMISHIDVPTEIGRFDRWVFLPPTATLSMNTPDRLLEVTTALNPPRTWSCWWNDAVASVPIDQTAEFGEKAFESFPTLLAKAKADTSANTAPVPSTSSFSFLSPGAGASHPSDPPPGTAWLGVRLAEGAPIVTEVFRGSPAAGVLQPGDLILSLGIPSTTDVATRFVHVPADVIQFVLSCAPGQQLLITARRGAMVVRVVIALAPRPAN